MSNRGISCLKSSILLRRISLCTLLCCFAVYRPFNMRICKPIAQRGFLTPICGPPLRTISGKLHNTVTVAARCITTPAAILLASRRAQCIERILRQNSTNLIPHPCNKASKRYFSSSLRNMTAEKIDGTAIAKGIRARLQGEIKKRQETNPRYKPSLTIVQGACPLKRGR